MERKKVGKISFQRPFQWAILMCFGALAVPLWGQHYFNINEFGAATSDILLKGQATTQGEVLYLTSGATDEVGASWYRRKRISVDKGFETEFTFQIEKRSGQTHGDGFAFVIQNASLESLGRSGSSLGYNEIPNGLALEFDTRNNREGSKNHVSVSVWDARIRNYRSVATVHEIPEITDGQEHFTRIDYKNSRLTVYMDSYLFPIVSLRIDLKETLGLEKGRAWVGFTASSSDYASVHKLLEWRLNELAEEPDDIQVDKVKIEYSDTLYLSNRQISLSVWDNNKVDGDKVSIKLNDEWILSNYVITKKDRVLNLSLTGFENFLVLYAQNLGENPPNTAAFRIDDGEESHLIELNADFEKSEAILIRFRAN